MVKVAAITADAFIHHCLENIIRLIPGSVGVYYLVDEQLTQQQHVLAGISPETHQHYLNQFLRLDPLHPQYYNALPVTFAGLEIDEAFRRSDYYRQFMKPHGMGDMSEIFIRRNRRIVAALSLMRDTPFSQPERMRLRATLPLVELATDELLPSAQAQRLTPKEQLIVDMIREGACNKRIASHLDISLSTVKTHLRNIFSKTQASNRTELLRNVSASWYGERAS